MEEPLFYSAKLTIKRANPHINDWEMPPKDKASVKEPPTKKTAESQVDTVTRDTAQGAQ